MYIETLNARQKEMIKFLIEACDQKKITNRFTKAAVNSIVSKECNFMPRQEIGYSKTPNANIRKIFGSRVSNYSEEQLTQLKASDEKFFNTVYGGRYGNTDPGDGYKFRGQGPNQLTFRGNFKKIGPLIGVDLEKNPEKINEPETGAKAAVQYFLDKIQTIPAELKTHYGIKTINDFKDLDTAVRCIYHSNAGWGKSLAAIKADVTGGLKKAVSRAPELLTLVP